MRVIVKVVISFILVFLILGGTYVLLDETVVPISKASFDDMTWNATMTIIESGGAGNALVFGEADNASDGQDDYDLPVPPFPPQLPYLTAWFDTNLDYPYNKLWHEYKQSPGEYKQWNLSILWMPEPGDESSTDIDISWDSSQLAGIGYKSVLLYEDNTVVVDMMTENSYEFKYPSGTSYHFQIICQSEMPDGLSENNETPFLPLIFVFTTIMLFALYRKKK